MERQKQQPWEEEEEDVALLRRNSRHINGDHSAHANGKANGGYGHAAETEEAEPNKELNSNNNEGYDAAAGFADENGDEASRLLKNSVYFDSHQGIESGHGLSGMKYTGDESSVFGTNPKYEGLDMKTRDFDIQKIVSTEITHQHGKNLEDEIFSSSSAPPVQRLCEEENINLEHVDDKTGVDADINLIEEIDQEFTEIDVERVLQKQNTHDLYCPNCKSCITRRVILRRKRRQVPIIRRPKHGKSETRSVMNANLVTAANDEGHEPVKSCSNDTPTPAADDDNRDRQPDIFRCLSCFSLFIPTGNGFKLFRVFGDSNENEKEKDVRNMPTPKTNWFFSIFATEKRKAATGQGDRASEHYEVDGINQHNSSCYGIDHPGAPLDDRNPVKARASEEDSQQGGVESMDHSKVEPLEKPPMAIDQETMISKTLADHNGLDISFQGASSQTDSFCSVGQTNCLPIESQEAGKGAVTSSVGEPIHANNVSSDVGKKSDDATVKTTEDDVMVIIDVQPRAQDLDNFSEAVTSPHIGTQINVGDNAGLEASEAHQWDILKSIVYGGLVELIASLSVVSSAAAAAASTMNILTLGLANLIGGLFIIFHNLRELRNDRSGETSAQTNEQEDQYQQLLGRRDNFPLHATVVVLSFLIFGLVPPVVYGFSFRKSDDRDLKIAAVAGSSLACIILLAVGKAHVQKPPKSYIRTVLYHVSIGLLSSGASYVVGDLIKILLDKLNLFESSVDVTIPSLERNLMNSGWASY